MYRIGTTSYILPDEILPNVEYLAPLVDDVELVLFETDEYGSNLPDAALCTRLKEIAEMRGITYTVHLPLDLRLTANGEGRRSPLAAARRVVDATLDLAPFAYVVHLDGRELIAGTIPLTHWQDNATRALETAAGWFTNPTLLCVENVEKWDAEAFVPVLARVPAGRTVDVGHLWLEGVEPMARLPHWIERARVVHLHGIADRDHVSLAHVPPACLDPVVAFLDRHFDGVVTLEVFSQKDLSSSLAALAAARERTKDERARYWERRHLAGPVCGRAR